MATTGDLATYFDHKVADVAAAKVIGYHIAHITLGDGRGVEDDTWVVLQDVTIGGEMYLFVAHELKDGINGVLRHAIGILEAEAPEVDKRSDGDVVSTLCELAYLKGLLEDGAHVVVDDD